MRNPERQKRVKPFSVNVCFRDAYTVTGIKTRVLGKNVETKWRERRGSNP
jgi:hypothetical protein